MQINTAHLTYAETNSFSKIVNAYINGDPTLAPFYNRLPSLPNCLLQLKEKAQQPIDRATLVEVLQKDYAAINTSSKVLKNINLLGNANTFTICTAHQPNIFTGHLYFVYKIIHTIKIAEKLAATYPNYNFVPVYYMGSEDADLDELGHINLFGDTLQWDTAQKGAVGRMVIDEAFIVLLNELEKQIATTENGIALIDLFKQCYTLGTTIQQATLALVNHLFGQYGLVVLIADNVLLKRQMIAICQNEINTATSHKLTTATTTQLEQHYKEQAHSRPINLFYLKDAIRNRIEQVNDTLFSVVDTTISFTKEALLNEIATHPENFSPNVILRGLYQEKILPNIAFVGGGGELAYWLQLKSIFEHYKVCYPILVLRNSFLLQTNTQKQKWSKLGFTHKDLFSTIDELATSYTLRNSTNSLTTNDEQNTIATLYDKLAQKVINIDSTLQQHIKALQKKQLNKLLQLDKKLLRAEKRNYSDAIRQLNTIKLQLFPNNNLQERWDNFIPYYLAYGDNLFSIILEHSPSLTPTFTILTLPK